MSVVSLSSSPLRCLRSSALFMWNMDFGREMWRVLFIMYIIVLVLVLTVDAAHRSRGS